MGPSIEELYPNIARWVNDYDWVEIGQDSQSNFFVKAFDEGEVVFGKEKMITRHWMTLCVLLTQVLANG